MKLQSYLFRMGLSLCILTCLGFFFASTLLSIFLSNPKLNVVIIGLTAAGVLYAFYQIVCLKNDSEVLEDLKQGQWSFSSRGHAHFLGPLLSFMSQSNTSLDPSLVRGLSDSLADRLENERVFPRYLIGLLVFLGLLGTFWGLSETIASIAHLIQNMPSESIQTVDFFTMLKENLQRPLSGMGAAFGSSLFGLGGSLLVGFLELQVGHAYGRFLNETGLYLTGRAHRDETKSEKTAASAAAPLSLLQALLTRNVEAVETLVHLVEKSEHNENKTTLLLDKLILSLTFLADQTKNHQKLMGKIAEGQHQLQGQLASLPAGIDAESLTCLQNIDRLVSHAVHMQREERDDFLRKLREEMRVIAHTVGTISDQQRLVG